MKALIGKILYGVLFVIVIPLLLVVWGVMLDRVVSTLPSVSAPIVGLALIGVGLVTMLLGWRALVLFGKGLPMNAFPPKELVTQDIYALIPHPIYTGFILMLLGYALWIASAAMLWIVTPIVILASFALVLGYENIDMQKRFGNYSLVKAIALPPLNNNKPTLSHKISLYLLLFLPWLLLYEATIFIGAMSDAIDTYMAFEQTLPVIEWSELIYAFAYLFVLLAPLLAKRQSDLRAFMIMGWLATFLGVLCFFLFPFQATPRAFIPTTLLGELLEWERSFDGSAAAFPAFHLLWSLLGAWLYTQTFGKKTLWYFIAWIIGISCITTGMHSLFDLIGALCLYLIVRNHYLLWNKTLKLTQWFANSWREWRIGRVRVINHGFYVGLGSFVGFMIAGYAAGVDQLSYVILVSYTALIGAGIWGQALEGSSKLARPFGFYGGLFGGFFGIFVAIILGANGWQLATAFALSGGFVQAIGRLRCLVQGCCHGRVCSHDQGIIVKSKQSRVIYLANLGEQPIYPTQLYSILYNIILALILFRMWSLDVGAPMIIGLYLLLGGLGRFVEEAYRGEPQTPTKSGLAVYQWLALFTTILGAVIMTFKSQPYSSVTLSLSLFYHALLFGTVVAFCMGVDFPKSNRRFSRLT
ncbi:MAG: prolipoprotein diacylglyceryl transferase family protein [Campylobacterota bacterium]|nr:prolipoprotein diacylglyceryl transferase family protein [Campylobacterota bacterium]